MLTTKEAAERLGIGATAVIFALGRGVMSGQKIGGKWRVNESEVARYHREHCRPKLPRLKEDGVRRCRACKEIKSLDECVKDAGKRGGYMTLCKVCHNRRCIERAKRPEVKARKAAAVLKWRQEHAEQYKQIQIANRVRRKRGMREQRKRFLGLIKLSPGVVYLLRFATYYKIGISRRLEKRVCELNTGMPFDPKVVCAVPTDYTRLLEKQLHELFRDKRTRREWFALTDADVEQIKRMAVA